MMKDELTLRKHKVVEGCKMMVVGSTLNDVMTVMPPSTSLEETKPERCERNWNCIHVFTVLWVYIIKVV